MTLYRTVVADPPWTPFMSIENGVAPKGSPQRHYATLTTEEIVRMRPPTTEQAHLYLWCVASDMESAYEVCRGWGFTPLILWTWAKAGLGVGRFRCNTEHKRAKK